jgi:hypothetical protein
VARNAYTRRCLSEKCFGHEFESRRLHQVLLAQRKVFTLVETTDNVDNTVNHTELLQRLATSGGSFVREENMADYEFERTYKNPIDKRPIHVYTSATNGSSVHLEDDGRLYTSFGPTVADDAEVAPRERGDLTEGMKTLIKMRAGDSGTVSALDGQPAPAQTTMENRDDATEPAVVVENNLDVEKTDQV